MNTYTANPDGTFTVNGVVVVQTEEQAKALLVETGIFDMTKWPFADRRRFQRMVVVNDGVKPRTYFVESNE
jgi:hypothetical protein